MAIPGGPAAKWGELYEGRGTVYTLLRLLDEDVDSIQIEVPGEDFAEFAVRAGVPLNGIKPSDRLPVRQPPW
jgi:hypothetical protein